MTPRRIVAEAFIAACRDELEAPKPGNVHVFAPGHRMTAAQFIKSATAAADPLCARSTRVAPALTVALIVAAAGTLYLGIFPSRVLVFAKAAADSLSVR